MVAVDNTERSYLGDIAANANVRVFNLGQNMGIAHALNVGVEYALKDGAEAIMYFDQDSEIEGTSIAALLNSLRPGQLGVASPVYFDRVVGYEFPSQRLSRYGVLRNEYRHERTQPYVVDVVISSGTAVTAVTYRTVGLMDENLFIDFVATEWCLRCRSRDVPIRVIPAATMWHSVGARTANVGRVRLAVHSPVRCYYQIRNCFLLVRCPHVPRSVALFELARVLSNRVLLLLFVPNKWSYVRSYWLAVMDGIRGVGGRVPSV